MTEQLNRFVAGVVNIDTRLGKDHPYSFFEIDTIDENIHQRVLENYMKFNLDVVSQRIGKGYHYFGNITDRQVWKEWYFGIRDINLKWPPLTLRITRKFYDEIFERPVYHEAQNRPPNWARALMHFLSKEHMRMNSTDLHKAMKSCSLPEYFKVVVYPLKAA